jgi:hypothetical protein
MAKRKSIKAPLERPVPKHEVVPSSHYRDPVSGRTFSPYSSWMPEGCELVTKGWTIRWSDGTEGTGRKAFETEAEANAYLAKMPKYFRGMSAMGS